MEKKAEDSLNLHLRSSSCPRFPSPRRLSTLSGRTEPMTTMVSSDVHCGLGESPLYRNHDVAATFILRPPTIAMSSTPAFLDLPTEIRLLVYSSYLAAHRRISQDAQPSNKHLHLLRTCKQIAVEAGPITWSYISLLYEGQINAFISRAPPELFERVRWVDAANDGRLWKTAVGKINVRL